MQMQMQCYCHCRFLPLPFPSAAFSFSASASSNSNSNSNSNSYSYSYSYSDSYSSSPNQRIRERERERLSKSAIDRISHKLRHLADTNGTGASPSPNPNSSSSSNPSSPSPGEIFIPTPPLLPPHRLASTLHPTPNDNASLPSLAELSLPPPELRRLRSLGIPLRHKLRIGKPGVTEGIVNAIHERWKRSELVKITCDDLSRINMKRTHHILETKTGGLVVWRSGSIIILYRGPNYKFPYFRRPRPRPHHQQPSPPSSEHPPPPPPPPLVPGVGSRNLVRLQLPGEAKLAQEADTLLHGLGPRFLQWRGLDPKPVDADLLPGLVMGFRKPFRVLPFGIKQGLTDSEMTTLRRLARPLPSHFALGLSLSLSFAPFFF